MLFYTPGFIFVFLPIVLTGYFLLGQRRPDWARIWLLGASLVFYTLGASANLVLLVSSIVVNFFLARIIGSERSSPRGGKGLLGAGIILNAGLLIYFKCLGTFSLKGLEAGRGYFLDVMIPLGLSFFTLQQIAFLVDAYKGRIRAPRLLRYALFISFFPQLIAGPIVRYQEIIPQLDRDETFRFRFEHLAVGSFIFILGALKKILIADKLAPAANLVFTNAAQGGPVMMLDGWIGALCFYLQLYYDFSAYSDMAIGVARMFGVTLSVNFNSPYQSRNLSQLFVRWHITFYRFLTDYLMIPMVAVMKKLPFGSRVFRVRFALCTATIAVFGLSGLWHGASLNFLLWGLMNGLAIVLVYLGKELRVLPRARKGGGKNYRGLAATFIFCIFASVVFRCRSLEQIGVMFRAMTGLNGISLPHCLEPAFGELTMVGIKFQGMFPGLSLGSEVYSFIGLLFFSLGLVLFGPNIYDLAARYVPALGFEGRNADVRRLFNYTWQPSRGAAVVMAMAAALLVILAVDPDGAGSTVFIYFNF